MKIYSILLLLVATHLLSASLISASDTLVLEGGEGPGAGKHIVLVSGDEEYRSEESNPMLAKILSQRFGFKCTVLFAINPETGIINPEINNNIPGLEALADADLMVLNTRFRNLPDEQLQHILDYVNAGKPIIGLRTATHAFNGGSKLGGVNWNQFGLDYLGERWVSHHGRHKVEGARGIVVEKNADHTVLRGVSEVFAESDVYTVKNLDESQAIVLLRAEVTESLDPKSKAVTGEKNSPTQAAAWLRDYTAPSGKTGTALTTTMGSSVDFKSAGLRRLILNGVLYLTTLEVPQEMDTSPIDAFNPTFFSRVPKEYYEQRKLTPSDFGLGETTSTGLPSDQKK